MDTARERMDNVKELHTPIRTIMTPGPVEVDPRVLRVMSTPILGQFDPAFTEIMNETMTLLRSLFQMGRPAQDLKLCLPV